MKKLIASWARTAGADMHLSGARLLRRIEALNMDQETKDVLIDLALRVVLAEARFHDARD